jgi:hypothetical protein
MKRPAAGLLGMKGGVSLAAGAWLVFEDESGFPVTPPTARTWAPRGSTVLVYIVHFVSPGTAGRSSESRPRPPRERRTTRFSEVIRQGRPARPAGRAAGPEEK